MSVAPNSGIVDFSTFTPPSGGQDGIQGQVPKPLAGQGGYVLTGSGWSSLGALGVISYQGTWNAATNTPTIVSGVGTQGYYYVVSVAGTTTIDGISNWGVGDWIIFNGSTWQKIEGGSQGNFTTLDVTGLATLATVDINGGTIDNTAIGSTTASTGVFTQLTAQQVAVRGGVNLLLRSQEFNSWSEANAVSVTANSIAAPDGTTTADTITADGTSAGHFLGSNTLTVSGTNTFSVYLKAGTSNYAQLLYAGDTTSFINFDLTPGAGAVGTSGGTVTGAIVDIGNGWYRCIAINTATTVTRARICIVNSSSATRAQTLTISTTIYAWGAQLEPGAVVNTYIPTTSSAITIENKLQVTGQAAIEGNAVAQDVIVQGGNNLVQRSQEFNNAYWTKNQSTISADATTAPDGTTTADLFYPTSSGSVDSLQRSLVRNLGSLSGTHTFSIYVKSSGFQWIRIVSLATSSSDDNCWFDVLNGVVGTIGTGRTGSIASVGNGWFRVSVSGPTDSDNNVWLSCVDANNSATATASGTNGVFLWGAQVEAGTVASPYTPTTSAAVTTTNDILVPSGQVQTALGSASLPSYSALGDTNTGMFFPAADTVAVGTGGSERLRIDSSGRLLLGLTTPNFGSNFEVAADNPIATLTDTDGTTRRATLLFSTAGGAWSIEQNNDLTIKNAGPGAAITQGTFAVFERTTGNLRLGTNATERMRIDSAGNVSIGTTDTSNGQLTVNGSSGQPVIRVTNTTNNNPYIQFQSGGFIQDTSSGNIRFRAGGATGVLQLDTNSTERYRITADGQLAASSDGTAAAPVFSRSSDLNTGLFFPAADTLAASTGGSERLRIDSSGRVFIGKTSDNDAVGITQYPVGSIYAVRDGGGPLGLNRLTSDGALVTLFKDTVVAGTIGSASGGMYFGTGSSGTERMRITSAGDVGIGTTSPAGKLQVSGFTPVLTSGYSQLNIFSTEALAANTGGRISFGGVSGNGATFDPYGFVAIAGLKENATASNFAGYFIVSTASSGGALAERMRIDSSGNLLVGTTATLGAAGLTLNNASNYFGLNLAVNGSLQGRLFQEATGNIYLDAGTTNTNGALVFRTNSGTERMRITPVGSAVIAQTWDKGTGRLQVTGQAAVEGNVVAQDVLVQGGNNLFQRSADFSDVYWNKLDSTATINVVASPDGTTTANSLVENSATGRHGFVRNIATLTGSIYTISIYAKQNTRRYFTVSLKNVSPATPRYSVTFDLQLGTVGQADSAGTPLSTSNSITFAGNGWYRLAISMQASSTSMNAEFGLATSGTFGAGSEGLQSYTGDGTSGVYIWGAQLELGTVASPYTPTTTAAVTTSNDLLVPSGNVGIGTSSPSALLELRKASPTTLVMSHTNGTGYETTISANYNAAESFSITSNTMKILSCVPNAIGGNGAVVLGSAANVVRVAGSSTLAVGSGDESSSPVAGIIRGANGTGTDITGARLTLQGGRGTGAAAGGPLVFSTAAAGTTGTTLNAVTERMRITPDGNIGIGRSIPTSYGAGTTTMSLDGTSGAFADFYFNGTRTGLIYSESARFVLDTVGAVPIIIRTGLTERMRITDTGNVGIGTSSPGAALQVVATSLQGIFEGSSQGAIRIKKAGVAGFQLYSDTAGTLGFYDDGSNATRMYINASGNVGIGTTSPSSFGQLVVKNDQQADTSIVVSNVGTASSGTTMSFVLSESGTKQGWFRRYRDGSGAVEIGFTDSLLFTGNITTTKVERMRIDSSGRVGIGTSSPSERLTVSGKALFSNGSLLYIAADSSATTFASASAVPMVFEVNSNERLRITSAGDVGIGTTSPGAKLDVSGTAQASQLRAATAYTVATLPTASAGMIARVTDGDAALAWGATVVNSGAGATPYLVWYNGTNWTVMGK